MIARLVMILALLAYAGSPSGANPQSQSSAPQSGSPTLAETTQWIETHVVGVAHGSNRTTVTYQLKKGKAPKEAEHESVNTHESVSMTRFDGCSMSIGQLTKGDDYSIVTISQVPFSRLIRASLKVENYPGAKTETAQESSQTTINPGSAFVITLEAPTNVITYQRRSTGSIPLEWVKTPFEGVNASLVIRSDDAEMPPRLVNAFNHAIQLCHKDAKPEPF
jgi:hypothetical protein